MIDFYNVTETASKSRIYIPYSIVSGVLFAGAILQFFLFFTSPYKSALRTVGKTDDGNILKHELSSTSADDESSNLIPLALPRSYFIAVILIGGALLCFEMGIEQNTFNYLQTFSVHVDLKLSKSTGAYMTSALSASYTASRLMAILFATKFSTLPMLYFDLIVILIGNLIVMFYANTSETGLWIGLIVLGAGFSSCFPAIYAFLEERINVTNTVCGMFMFMSSIGTTVSPLLEGKYIETWPLIFVWINLVSVVICILLFIGLHCTDIMKQKYGLKRTNL
jgi:fucose permease